MKQHISRSRSLFMLPPYFKTAGLIIVILGSIPLAYRKFIDSSMHVIEDTGKINYGVNLTQGKLDIFHFVFLLVAIAGLLVIAWSREKVEDEVFALFRTRALIITFVLAIAFVIVFTALQVVSGVMYWPFFGIELVTGMLISFNLAFYLQKKFVP